MPPARHNRTGPDLIDYACVQWACWDSESSARPMSGCTRRPGRCVRPWRKTADAMSSSAEALILHRNERAARNRPGRRL